ncbi:hypothetical protein N7468_009010 [Penicillium chermesinum]|uniref:C3H1-type domain-containing protein n=1 Tax=Penicillium chermesinum TaxID=63820 RepID=A0A9W9NH60_9EURO|nr:uncharacterized protein N7468_009010 [Penicillium chermesinum]KAJ5219806.1 hypothetical protein N7468_009010 [Penicillium chermesinum]
MVKTTRMAMLEIPQAWIWPAAHLTLATRVRILPRQIGSAAVLYGFILSNSMVDTKHVPCKFFRQGACQAGPACPFLHSTDAAVEYTPCKYFTKVGEALR